MFETTHFIFCRFSNVNDNKMGFVTLKWLFWEKNHLYKVIYVIIIMQILHFNNYTGKQRNSVILENGIRYFRK